MYKIVCNLILDFHCSSNNCRKYVVRSGQVIFPWIWLFINYWSLTFERKWCETIIAKLNEIQGEQITPKSQKLHSDNLG